MKLTENPRIGGSKPSLSHILKKFIILSNYFKRTALCLLFRKEMSMLVPFCGLVRTHNIPIICVTFRLKI